MLIFRLTLVLLLMGVVACFVFYVATGQVRYRTVGVKLIKWAIIASMGFFGVLLLERLL